jgi:hypothetical protein
VSLYLCGRNSRENAFGEVALMTWAVVTLVVFIGIALTPHINNIVVAVVVSVVVAMVTVFTFILVMASFAPAWPLDLTGSSLIVVIFFWVSACNLAILYCFAALDKLVRRL